jgi:hypothetical protein
LLPLGTKDLLYRATKVLEEMKDEIDGFLAKNELKLNVKGVNHFTFGPNSKESRVIYAGLEWNDALVDLTDMIVKRMIDKDVLFDNELGNTKYDAKYDRYMAKFH